jgi:putative ABC transport system permease protein
MTLHTFLLNSLRHYGRSHLGLLLGVALSAAILSGSLLVGDSVRASLGRVAKLRLGQVQSVVLGGERWFTQALAGKTAAAPAIMAMASVSAASGESRANNVQVLGVDSAFWKLSPSGQSLSIASGDVAINEALASRLQLKPGDSVVVRMEKPSALSRDAPLSGSSNDGIALRRKVGSVVKAVDFGAFNVLAAQISPETVFFEMADLQGQIEMDGRINTLLSAEPAATLQAAMEQHQSLADFALRLQDPGVTPPVLQLSTDRVFMDQVIADRLLAHQPGSGALTYLVNGLTSVKGGTPYSMVTAVDAFAKEMPHPESDVVISQWLADDQKLVVGDRITLRYFVVGIGRELKEASAEFTVSAILAMTDPRVSRSWTPEFPGVSDVDNCSDWDPGFPMDNKAIRDQDEKYWDDYKGTPKAFVSLAAGQRLWGNRFGQLTGLRFAKSEGTTESASLAMVRVLNLGDVSLVPRDIAGQAAAAARGSVDFGGLFIGLSLFLIVAALVFAALLFVFMAERRASEMGLLLALGWTPKLVRGTLLREGFIITVVGSLLGLCGGVLYTKAALHGLGSVWGGATGGLALSFDMSPVTLGIAFAAAVLLSLAVLWWITRSLLKAEPTALLSGSLLTAKPVPTGNRARWVAVVCGLLAVGLAFGSAQVNDAQMRAGLFFGAGMMLLIAGLAVTKVWLVAVDRGSAQVLSLAAIGRRNITRRPSRSMAALGMMAAGIFLVVAVNAFRMAGGDPALRSSGTGGFAFIADSALPVYEDLNSKRGQEIFGLDAEDMVGVSVQGLRVRPGDDASCLNLNRAQSPQLVGTDMERMARLGAFSFASGSWQTALDTKDAIPAVVDQATAMWGLQKGVGDVMDFPLGKGRSLQVRIVALLAGSVLQGKVIIPEADFIAQLPDVAGYRFFLIDCPAARQAEVRSLLSRQLEQRGLAIEPTQDRLLAFLGVQNTYISIFTVLGGLGVLLGTLGLGVLVERHVLERRGELALMQAIGFLPGALRRMVLGEHAALLIGGLLLGSLSALVAVWPALQQPGDLPLPFIAALLVGIFFLGLVICGWATRRAMGGNLAGDVRE